MIYSDDKSKVILQISDLYAFFDKQDISESDIEALLIKSKVIEETKNCSKEAVEKAASLPIVPENLAVDDTVLANKQKEVDVYQGKDEGLEDFIGKPLVDQFNELFKITEDPLDKIIKTMESKGHDKYATFNPEDIEFYPDAFDLEFW